MAAFFDDDEEQTIFPVALDDLTVARLMELCDDAKVEPRLMIAAILRDVLEDDFVAHREEAPGVVRKDANNDLH